MVHDLNYLNTHIYICIYIYLYWVGCIPWFLFRYWNLFWIIDDVVQYLQWLSVEIIQNCSSITCSSEMEITQDYGIPAVLVMDIVQYCGICSVLAMGIPQYCTEPCNNNKKFFCWRIYILVNTFSYCSDLFTWLLRDSHRSSEKNFLALFTNSSSVQTWFSLRFQLWAIKLFVK